MADTTGNQAPDPTAAGGLAACPIGLVPLGWPDPGHDLGGFLREIADLGFAGIQFAAPGADTAAVRARFEEHGVRPAERYWPIRCSTDGPAPDSLEVGCALLREVVALGGGMLVAAVDGSPERDRWTGRADRAPALTSDAGRRLATLLDEVGRRAADVGVALTFHPHAGTFVETPAETERLMAATDADLVGLCLDTGHWLVGGGDPLAAAERYGDRIRHVHLKSVDPDVHRDLRNERLPTLTDAVDEVVFCPLGTGTLALGDLLATLARSGYRGWLMVEQDSFRGRAQDVAAASRRALQDELDRLG